MRRIAAPGLIPAVFLSLLVVYGCGGGGDSAPERGANGSGSGSGSGGGAGGNVGPFSVAVSRTSGVGPLYVFFSASGVPNNLVCSSCDPFRDFHYTWNFGDADAPDFTTGTRTGAGSGNVAYGPVAAHVFDPPLGTGTAQYNVTLTVTDGTNTLANYAVATIAVTDANSAAEFATTNTVCISTSGTFTGCPAGATHTTSNDYDVSINGAVARRYLLRCGETFEASVSENLRAAGPAMIGTFGPGASPVGTNGCGNTSKPIVNATASNVTFAYLDSGSDWRIAGIDFRANGNSSIALHNSIGAETITNILVYQNTVSFDGGIFVVDTTIVPNYVGIVANTLNNIENETVYGWGHGVAVMGNRLNVTCCGASGIINVVRTMGMDHAVISNNTMGGSTATGGGGYIQFRVHDTAGAPQAGYAVISENVITHDSNYGGIATTPLNPTVRNQHITEVIIEGNYILANSATAGEPIGVSSRNTDVRNNIINITQALNSDAILLRTNDACSNCSGGAQNVRVFNNSVRRVGGSVVGVRMASTTTNPILRNNLVYGSGGGQTIVSSGTVTGITESHNTCGTGASTSCAGTLTTSPTATWVNTSGLFNTPTEFAPKAGGYAIGAGTSVPVWDDFFHATQPNPRDLGAIRH